MLTLLLKLIAYGHIGFLLEIWFTGLHSIIWSKDKTGSATTYLPMFLIYGFTALALEGVSEALPWPFYLKALIYVPIIYGVEGLSGWTLKKLVGKIPWDYPQSAWAPAQLINLKYAPIWLLVALSFDFIALMIQKITIFVTQM